MCGLLFTGVTVTFLPMHLTGLLGMPRRVYTYAPDLGSDALNLVSSAGSVLIAAAIGLLLFDVARHLRPTDRVDVDPWHAGTLEWLPLGNYGSRGIALVMSREPRWDQPGLREEVDRGEHYLRPRSAACSRSRRWFDGRGTPIADRSAGRSMSGEARGFPCT